MIYKLPGIISKDALYNKILPDLTRQYKELKEDEVLGISLIYTEQIYSNALPLFIGMLSILKNRRNRPVYLELAYNPRLLAFLSTTGFFRELLRYGVIECDERYLGGLPEYNYNKENKILFKEPVKDYDEKSEGEKQEIRDIKADELRGEMAYTYLFKRMKYDELRDVTLTASIELIVNAIIHSGSRSYAYMQAGIAFSERKKGYLLSIVDVGKGFYSSLGEKIARNEKYTQEERDYFYQYAQELGYNLKEEIHFLSIMEALYYSERKTIEQNREQDLFKLKKLLADSKANFRIHQKNKEIVFTHETCSQCADRSILHCVKCIREKLYTKKSPLKTYPVAMAGVHVEIEFVQENNDVRNHR